MIILVLLCIAELVAIIFLATRLNDRTISLSIHRALVNQLATELRAANTDRMRLAREVRGYRTPSRKEDQWRVN